MASPAMLSDLNGVFSKFISGALVLVAMISIVMIVLGGINYMGAGGDKEGLSKAKGTITLAIIGLVLAVSAWMILNIFARWLGLGDVSNFDICFSTGCP